jgi:hypothetical protein
MRNVEEVQDESWNRAYEIVRSTARIPHNLPHLVRACWNDLVSPTDLVRLLGSPGLPLRSLLRAANIPHISDSIKHGELTTAVEILGVKASAIILAINCVCERTLDSGPSTKVWSPLLKEMMSEIEIGYHLGSSVEKVGYEQGMAIGFSRLAGLALLLISAPKSFPAWYEGIQEGPIDPKETALIFGCEPYQVSSALMQHLGLGTEIALATASTLANADTTVVETHSTFQTWRAAYHWIHALKRGDEAPLCDTARSTFTELCMTNDILRAPEHLAILREQVAEIRQAHSLWTWHLPFSTYEETAQAIVYRVNSNARGTTWTKGLVQPSR